MEHASVDGLSHARLVGCLPPGQEASTRWKAEGLLEGGLKALELDASAPSSFSLVADLSRAIPEARFGLRGAENEKQLSAARDAGAHFVSFPYLDSELVRAARARGLLVVPGALTPTEIHSAHGAGADFVKLFPLSVAGGPRLLRALRVPFRHVRLWASGDPSLDEVGSYFAAGAELVELSTALTAELPEGPRAGRAEIARRAAAGLEAAAEASDQHVLLVLESPGGTETRLDRAGLRGMPASYKMRLQDVVPGRRGEGVRLQPLLAPAGLDEGQVSVCSADGFRRELSGEVLARTGVLQFAIDDRPLERDEGGPVRLYLVDGSDRCDNVKQVCRIEPLNSP
ncbi:MAG: molybdopterin-dependent oxidoreductase [Myxococcota bacterium]